MSRKGDRAYLKRLKQQVLFLLGGECQICGSGKNLQRAHLTWTPILDRDEPIGRGGKQALLDARRYFSSYALLCEPCHNWFDSYPLLEVTQVQKDQKWTRIVRIAPIPGGNGIE